MDDCVYDKAEEKGGCLKLKNLSISFDGKRVVENINLNIKEKEFIGVVGKNASGKTTLAYLLAGVIPDFIDAEVKGCFKLKNAALIMQNPSSQFLAMTVREELGNTNGFDIDHLIDRSVFQISEGEKQKINLISNLDGNDVLILDEPLELLDPVEAKRFLDVINKLKHKKTIIWFDKDKRFLRNADRIINLSKANKHKIKKTRRNISKKKILTTDFSYKNNGFSLKNIKLELRNNEKIALIGRNGCGKTTVLKAIAGILRYKGVINKKSIAYAPQNPVHIFFTDNVLEEMKTGQSHIGITDTVKSLKIRNLLKKDPNKLSKGQQKLVSVAVAVSANAETLLLDEPTTWLDDENKALVYGLIQNSARSMIIATHDAELINYVDKIYFVGGGIRQCSSTEAKQFLTMYQR